MLERKAEAEEHQFEVFNADALKAKMEAKQEEEKNVPFVDEDISSLENELPVSDENISIEIDEEDEKS